MKIAVLVSGGVDSSVALALLRQKGYDVTAFYLKIWLEDELSFLGTCPWQEDLHYVEAVCKKLNVPLEVVSLQQEYWDRVVAHTITQVKCGNTPNPDILCNSRVKFGAFFDHIDSSYELTATGHYAQTERRGDKTVLLRSPDAIKDQTYFLSHLSQAQIARALFPIGHLQKNELRAYAHELDLPTKNRKDSQGICFLGKLKFSEFLKCHLGEQKGDLIEYETNRVVGSHVGYWFYTIGQRQGIGLAGGPWYVVAKNSERNNVYISRDYYSIDKTRDLLHINQCNWITTRPTKTNLQVKLRHGKQLVDCMVREQADDLFELQLMNRDQGIAAGQHAVLYDGNECLGGGIIVQPFEVCQAGKHG